MAASGISTLGVKFGYSGTVSSTTPTSFTLLTRINEIGGITIEPEQIDASALEDEISRYIAGRADTGGSVSVTVNATAETIAEWKAVFTASKTAAASGTGIWFEVFSPQLSDGFFFIAQTPDEFPMPEMAQNELMTVEIPLTIVEYKGLATKVEPTAAA